MSRLARLMAMGVLGGKKSLYQRILSLSPDLYWPLNDASGTAFVEATGKTGDTIELVTNPGFETRSGDDFGTWEEALGVGGAITAETTIVHTDGGVSCKMVQATPATNCNIGNYITKTQHGRTYEFSFWTRGDGTNAGRYAIKDQTHNTWPVAFATTTGVTGTTWTKVTVSVTAPGSPGDGAVGYYLYFIAPAAAGGTAYFDDASVIGKNIDFTGRLIGTGTTFEDEVIGGTKSLLLDGNALINIFSDYALPKLFDSDPITILTWGKPNFTWATEATNRDLFGFTTGVANRFVNFYDADFHKLNYRCTANSSTGEVKIDDVPTGWFSSVYVHSGGVLKPYYNGVAQTTANVGVWSTDVVTATALANTYDTTPFHSWKGNYAHVAIWFRELSVAEIALVGKL